MLHRVGDVHELSIDAGPLEGLVEQPPRWTDKRMPGEILAVTGLLAHQHDQRLRVALAEYGACGALPEVASPATGRRVAQRLEPAVLRNVLAGAKLVSSSVVGRRHAGTVSPP